MPAGKNTLTQEQMGTILGELRSLVESGQTKIEAVRFLAKRWEKGESTIYRICRGVGMATIEPEPLDLQGVTVNAAYGKTAFREYDSPPQPVRNDISGQRVSHKAAPQPIPQFGYEPHTVIDIDPNLTYSPIKHKDKVKSYIITGWEIRIKPDFKFIDCLKQLAKHHKAELCLAPHYLPDLDFLPPELRMYFRLLTADEQLNANLMFRYVETHALAVSPLTGWRGVSEKTQIIPGLIKQLETYPTDSYTKMAVTTGSIGNLTLDSEHYKFIKDSADDAYKKRFDQRWNAFRSQKKPVAIASEFVMPSALIIHVLDDKHFLARRVTMQTGNDHLFDLDLKFTAGKTAPQRISPILNVGDSHWWFADPNAVRCTFEQIDTLKPSLILVNDFFDGCSANHHEKDRPFEFRKAPPISVEAAYTQSGLELFHKKTPKTRKIYLHSNHDDFLSKFLDAGEKYWLQNYNYETCVELQQKRMSTGRHPIELLIDFPKTGFEFWTDNEPFKAGRVAVLHGHQMVNGKRTGFHGLASHFNYLSMNHIHSPKEHRNAVAGGFTGIFGMSYTQGSFSGMLHANTLIHADGSMQLLTMIDGKWMV